MWSFLYRLASPQHFEQITKRWCRVLSVICIVAFAYGLTGALLLAPADYQQGDAFRIIYLHVPNAFLSLLVYSVMTFCAVLSLVWRIKLADIVLKVSAPLGAWFTFLALVTGSLWGKPMWGTYWIWDARLTSELILLFLYLGILALGNAIDDPARAAKARALLTVIGFVDIPIIHYSVDWWNTLHQGATISKLSAPSIAGSMLYPLLAMIFAFFTLYLHLMLSRARIESLHAQQESQWVQRLLANKGVTA
jgi:heme exporter protein C